MNKLKSSSIPLILLAILIAVAILLYFLKPIYTCWPYCSGITDQDRETIKEQNRETYVNSRYSFSFQYPSSWTYKTISSDANVSLVHFFSFESAVFPVMAVRNPIKEVGYEDLRVVKTEKITLPDGKYLTRTSFISQDDSLPMHFIHVTWNENDWFNSGEIWLSSDDYNAQLEEITNGIVSSFKFIDNLTESPVSEWKMYENSQYGFSLQYPAGTIVTNEDSIFTFRLPNSQREFILSIIDQEVSLRESNTCNDTASGSDFQTKMINGVQFQVIDWSKFKGAVPTSATRYCVTLNNVAYKIIVQIPYGYANTPEDVNKDDVLNRMLSTFKFSG